MRAASAIAMRTGAAALVFVVALDGGAYSPVSRGTLAIVVWWTLAVLVATDRAPQRGVPRGALVTLALLAAFSAFTLASTVWADAPEKAFAEFDRCALYVGVLGVAVLVTRFASRAALGDGLALGIVGVAALALAGRCFPDLLPAGDLPRFLPGASARLSYPVGYWNGLAVLAALAVPLLLRPATVAASAPLRGLAAAPLPALASVIYLASSRGGALAAAVGALVFVATTPRRGAALTGLVVAAAGSAAAIAVLVARPQLVDGPLGSEPAAVQGRSAALLLLLVCAATGVAHALTARATGLAPALSGRVGRLTAVAAAAIALTAVVALDPVEAFTTFKEPPREFLTPQSDFVRAHLLSGGGSGRWQFWSAAVDEFQSSPLHGGGAGSYEAWWAEHGSLAYFVRDAHSLYVETLGELGLVGLALLSAAFAAGLIFGVRSLRVATGAERASAAALLAAFAAFAVAAGIDWMWELTVVSVVGFAALGVLLGGSRAAPVPIRRGLRAAAVVTGSLMVAFQGVPLLVELELRESQAAVRSGDLGSARRHAKTARDLQPWAASPWLQLALVEERNLRIAAARGLVGEALQRDPADWRQWLVAARLAAKAGDVAEARRSLARARSLNPRSPLFPKNR